MLQLQESHARCDKFFNDNNLTSTAMNNSL